MKRVRFDVLDLAIFLSWLGHFTVLLKAVVDLALGLNLALDIDSS